MSKKQIYVVFACDEWKSRDSMRLLMATTSVQKLKSFVARKIGAEEFDYGGSDLTRACQVKLFKQDFKNALREDINRCLTYGYIDYCYDGEEV